MIKVNKTNEQKYSYAKILVMGESGVGKTYFLGTVPEKEMLIINVVSESGLSTLRGKNIDVIDVNNYPEMIEVAEWLKNNGSQYKYVAIDSLSQWQKNLEDQLVSSDKFKLWKDIKDKTKQVVNAFKMLPFHIVCITEVKIEKDEESGIIKYLPSLAGASRDEVCYWFDEVYFFDRAQEQVGKPIVYRCLTSATNKFPCKSRAGNLPVIITNPRLEDIIKTMNKDAGKIPLGDSNMILIKKDKKAEIVDFSKKI